MPKPLKAALRSGVFVSALEEVPRISDRERADLRDSLDRASAEMDAGEFDEVTSESLRAEFDAVYRDGKSDAEIDADLAERAARKN